MGLSFDSISGLGGSDSVISPGSDSVIGPGSDFVPGPVMGPGSGSILGFGGSDSVMGPGSGSVSGSGGVDSVTGSRFDSISGLGGSASVIGPGSDSAIGPGSDFVPGSLSLTFWPGFFGSGSVSGLSGPNTRILAPSRPAVTIDLDSLALNSRLWLFDFDSLSIARLSSLALLFWP